MYLNNIDSEKCVTTPNLKTRVNPLQKNSNPSPPPPEYTSSSTKFEKLVQVSSKDEFFLYMVLGARNCKKKKMALGKFSITQYL